MSLLHVSVSPQQRYQNDVNATGSLLLWRYCPPWQRLLTMEVWHFRDFRYHLVWMTNIFRCNYVNDRITPWYLSYWQMGLPNSLFLSNPWILHTLGIAWLYLYLYIYIYGSTSIYYFTFKTVWVAIKLCSSLIRQYVIIFESICRLH